MDRSPPTSPDPLRRRALALALLAFASPLRAASGGFSAWPGGATPPLALPDLEGREVRLASFRGRTVVLNFWATWCGPCVAEMPALEYLRETLADDGVEVLAVNHREPAERVKPFVERFGFTFPVLRDANGAATQAFGVRAFPTSFVVGPDGGVAFAAVGEIAWSSAPVVARVRAVAGAGPAPRMRTALR